MLAAMSGGVDSAVAAARAVDAGHDVTGVHLALARNPQTYRSRRARLLHPRGRPGRPPGRRRDRHPVLRLGHGRRVPRQRGGRLRRRVRGRPYAQPVPALQREDQVRRGAGPGGRARLRRRGHRPPRPARRRTACCAARSTWPRTSRTCSRCSPATQLDRSMFPLGDSTKAAGARRRRPGAGWRWPRSPTRTTSASSPTATPGGSWPPGWARARAPSSTREPGEVRRPARGRVRVHRRPAQGAAPDPARRRTAARGTCCRSRPVTNTVTVGPAAALEVSTVDGDASGVDGRAAAGRAGRVRGAAAGPRRGGAGRGDGFGRRPADGRAARARCAGSPPARRSSPTGPTRPATSCSARPPSPGPAAMTGLAVARGRGDRDRLAARHRHRRGDEVRPG